jgi:hypothetical protein
MSCGGGPAAWAADGDGVALLQPTTQIGGARRVALVIGNGAYVNVPALKNTVQDASSIATKLRGLGYQIQYAQNVDRRAMNEAISAFLARIEPGMEATVYYAGHGVELNGANFLLPTDIPALDPEQERMLRTEGVNVNDLLLDISDRHANVTLVILDACRDNPFHVAGTYGTYRSLGATRGLATVAPPRGSFVIFSAGAGEEALDNLGGSDTSRNGLFTRKLLALMDKDGLELRELVRELRVEVSDAAASTPDHHSQVPGYYDQMLGDFYFRPRGTQLREAEPVPVEPPAPGPQREQAVQPPPPSPPPTPGPDLPQKVANLPPETPPSPAPLAVCQPGEERRDGVCQPVACAANMKRNEAGICESKTTNITARRKSLLSKKTHIRAKPASIARSSIRCIKFGSNSLCGG